jgi:hypothetical protein
LPEILLEQAARAVAEMAASAKGMPINARSQTSATLESAAPDADGGV